MIVVKIFDENGEVVDPYLLTNEGLAQVKHLCNQLIKEIDSLVEPEPEFSAGDSVIATPDAESGESWNEFTGLVVAVKFMECGHLYVVEDIDGYCFDCFARQLKLIQ